MTPLYKYATTGVLTFTLIAAPFATFAAGTSTAKTGGFCARVDTVTQKVESTISTVAAKIDTNNTTRQSKMAANRAQRDATLKANRAQWAANRTAQYQKIMARATTTAEQAAVTQFSNTVNAAIATREQAIDAAIATYRSGIDSIVNTKFGSLNTDVTTLQQAVTAASATATNACANGETPATVRTNYLASVKAARSTFQGDRKTADIKTQIQTLEATRKAAVQSALDQFKTSVDGARTTLKAAF